MGLMNRALDLQTRQQARSAPPKSLLGRAKILRQPPTTFDAPTEEVLIQVIQAIPQLPPGFAGLYQSFHILRDLLGFDKLMLLCPGETDPECFEPMVSYGFDETSRTRFTLFRESIPQDLRSAPLGHEFLDELSDRDRESLDSPLYVLVLGQPNPRCVLVGSGYFTKIQDDGIPVFGPITQILDLHVDRFLQVDVSAGIRSLVSLADLEHGLSQSDLTIRLDLEGFARAFHETYADVLEYRGKGLLLALLQSFLPTESLLALDGQSSLVVFVPAKLPAIQRAVGTLLRRQFAHWFQLPDSDSLIELRPLSEA